ncbi:hypothetical protein [Enterococcus dongliensis]|uniref:hypothetical protein n=1 Tax=Enterococcus dongliensis TaxID=2559925 RepID=UPI00288C7F6E|nr:hypothetical protein [Enterococcus dongliensis]MDT2671729.1 hypothetical protein [Enterococcus dongliensis]
MQSLFAILLGIGFLAIIVGTVMLLLALVKKTNKRTSLIVLAASFAAMVIGAVGVTITAPDKSTTSSSSKIEKHSKENSTIKETSESKQTSNSSTKTSTEESSSTIESSSSSESDSINTQIAAYLEQNKGFANGTLDENGNPTENGTPNPVFNWALTINEIDYEENLLKVNVNDNFLTLSQTDASSAILSAQNAAVSIVSESENWDMDKASDGIFTQIYYNGNVIGRSKMTDVKEFKWK